jgi:hypothetical protein
MDSGTMTPLLHLDACLASSGASRTGAPTQAPPRLVSPSWARWATLTHVGYAVALAYVGVVVAVIA